MKVAIVILNWNGKKFLEKFLPSVIKHSSEIAEIIIADNNSTDDSVAFIKDNYPEIRIIINPVNGGFAKGYNDALKYIDAEYYLLLNSDIEVTENWLQPLIDMMDSNKQIAACQPKLLSFYEKNKFEYAGAGGGFIDRFGYPFCRGRIFFSIEEDKGQYDDNCEIFWATGACMMVRADLYHRFGGFDDDFFAHMEEIDFCWRLKSENFKIMYCGESLVYHVGGGTLPKSSAKKTYLNFRNNLTLIYKNLPGNLLMYAFLIRIWLDFFASIKFLFSSGFKDFYAVIRAHLSFIRNYRKNRRKRKAIHQTEATKIYKGCLVWQHYIRKIKSFSELNHNDLK